MRLEMPMQKERPVAEPSEAISVEQSEERLNLITEAMDIANEEFKKMLVFLEDGVSKEMIYMELDSLEGFVATEAVAKKWPEGLTNGIRALIRAPYMIVNQILQDRYRAQQGSRSVSAMSEERRRVLFELSDWQQLACDYYLSQQGMPKEYSMDAYQFFNENWADFAGKSKKLVQTLIPDVKDAEFRGASSVSGVKQGCWGVVGAGLALREKGYRLFWGTPETDVFRKIDVMALSSTSQEELGISCKAWRNIENHIVISNAEDLLKAPYVRRMELEEEWVKLRRGVAEYNAERRNDPRHPRRQLPLKPCIIAVSTSKQDQRTARLEGGLEGIT